MALPFLSDLADILNLEEFAVAANYSRVGGGGDATINGVFDKRMNKEGAIAGMAVGLAFTFIYIVLNVFVDKTGTYTMFGIKATGIGTVGMLLHFVVAYFVSRATAAPPQDIQDMVENIRIPRGAAPSTHAH